MKLLYVHACVQFTENSTENSTCSYVCIIMCLLMIDCYAYQSYVVRIFWDCCRDISL